MATNTNVTAIEICPLGGATNSGYKLGFIESAAKAAQNDTWTVSNASAIKLIVPIDDSDGLLEIATISTNIVTLTSASTGAASALIVYK
jgi:hypothetical protein